jgi:hypothetical protein
MVRVIVAKQQEIVFVDHLGPPVVHGLFSAVQVKGILIVSKVCINHCSLRTVAANTFICHIQFDMCVDMSGVDSSGLFPHSSRNVATSFVLLDYYGAPQGKLHNACRYDHYHLLPCMINSQ